MQRGEICSSILGLALLVEGWQGSGNEARIGSGNEAQFQGKWRKEAQFESVTLTQSSFINSTVQCVQSDINGD